MAYDETLAQRILDAIGDDVVDTKKMFGGLAVLLDGNMAVLPLRSIFTEPIPG